MKSSISLLIQVAASDSVISDTEAKTIRHIAHANGIPASEVNDLFNLKADTANSLKNITAEERFNVLYLMIRLMQADGQTFTSEVRFCERLATG